MRALLIWLKQEPVLKLASVLIAMGLWAWRSSEGNPLEERRFVELPVKVLNLDEGLTLVSEPPPVNVTLYGPRRTLDRLQAGDDVQPVIDLDGYAEPSWPSVDIEVRTPETVDVRQVQPAEWEAEIDVHKSDLKPVQVDFGNTTPREGYIHEQPELQQSQAQVSGPRRRVDRVAAVQADVNLSGRTETVSAPYVLRPVDSTGQQVPGVEVQPRRANVTVRIAKAEETRQLPVAVPLIGAPAAGFEVRSHSVEPQQVTVSGTTEGFEQLQEAVPTTSLDIGGRESSFTKELPLVLPRGVAARPRNVQVRVEIARVRNEGEQP